MRQEVSQLQGVSGRVYSFAIRRLPADVSKGCGVYIFVRMPLQSVQDVLYIGRASEFSERLNDRHEKFGPARLLGMAALGQLCCANDQSADAIERDLIANFNPPLNTVHCTNR